MFLREPLTYVPRDSGIGLRPAAAYNTILPGSVSVATLRDAVGDQKVEWLIERGWLVESPIDG